MEYKDLMLQVSKEVDLPFRVVDKIYKSYWRSIRMIIQDLPLKDDLSEKEFQKLRTNFNIPSLGKLSCTYDRAKGVKERFKYIKNIREKHDQGKENKTDVHSIDNHHGSL